MTEVSLHDVTMHYGGARPALDSVTLTVPAGQLTAVLGPSGCGKTTLLRLVAGLIHPTAGDVRFDGTSILPVPAERRGAVMVFQHHVLFPYLSVGDNVAFGLRMRGMPAREQRRKVAEMLELVQLGGLERRKPDQLSGGQQQRVALARALVVEPRVLLLDEPLSNLDANLRDEMRGLIRQVQRQQDLTTVVVTHDQEEAVMLADQVALLLDGVLQQVDEPGVFYRRPVSMEVARFFGAGYVTDGEADGAGVVHTPLGALHVNGWGSMTGPVQLAVRPEAVRLVEGGGGGDGSASLAVGHRSGNETENLVAGTVTSCVFAGTHTRVVVSTGDARLDVVADAGAAPKYRPGDPVRVALPPDALMVFPRLPSGADR